MVKIMYNLDEFLNTKFNTISLGLTPSGELHLGFLTTLACAFLYIKKNPSTNLKITILENTLDFYIDKYNYHPIRFQNIGVDGRLEVPETIYEFNQKNSAGNTIESSLNDLIWKLVQIYDNKTKQTIEEIRKSTLSKQEQKMYLKNQNKIHHMFSSNIYVYNLMHVLKTQKNFQRKIYNLITNPKYVAEINKIAMLDSQLKPFDKTNHYFSKNKKHCNPQVQFIPVRIYCPHCFHICKSWARVLYGHPEYSGPQIISQCGNTANCDLAKKSEYIVVDPKVDLHKIEMYFLLGILREFYEPFKADCRVFGGDYSIESSSSKKSFIDKMAETVDFFEKQTKQQKAFFCAPLITYNGEKMSKSQNSFKIKDLNNITATFSKIVDMLEKRESVNNNTIDFKELA